jgi:putative transposase
MKALYKSYPSNLTSDQWAIMEPYLPAAKPGGRPPRVNLRAVLDAIFYFLYSGCAWRRFQGTFPLGLSVYTYFQGWREQGVWERINPYLRQWVRLGRTVLSAPVLPSSTLSR